MPRRPVIGFALALGLVAATVAVYLPVTAFPFVSIDDALYVSFALAVALTMVHALASLSKSLPLSVSLPASVSCR